MLVVDKDEATNLGSLWEETMNWFSRTTSIAGIQVSNWMIALGAIIVILLVYLLMS
jgi:hypothetical protein